MNKYGAVRTYSHRLERWFASKRELWRAEELAMAEQFGGISNLRFQEKFVLSEECPRITIAIDFAYIDTDGTQLYEDSKGVLTRDTRTKLAWLKEKHGVDVLLS